MPSDLPIFFAHQCEPEAVRMADFSSRDEPAFHAHWAKILRDESLGKKTILVDGDVAGNVVCFGSPGEREVGYWLGREHWGKGVATLALSAFLQLIPERPLYAHAAAGNSASIRVLQKCGFQKVDSLDPAEITMTLA